MKTLNPIERSVSIDESLYEILAAHADTNGLDLPEIVRNEIARFFRLEELKRVARSN